LVTTSVIGVGKGNEKKTAIHGWAGGEREEGGGEFSVGNLKGEVGTGRFYAIVQKSGDSSYDFFIVKRLGRGKGLHVGSERKGRRVKKRRKKH